MATWRLPLVRRTVFSYHPQPLSLKTSSSSHHLRFRHDFVKCASVSMDQSTQSTSTPRSSSKPRWKPTCLYFTQGRCTMEDEAMHLEKFSHSCSLAVKEAVSGSKTLKGQNFDYFLVLDLEGKVEILEFPVLLFDVKAMDVKDVFHRFVRPTKMTEERINDYIEGKYGNIGVDRVWHDTAIKFEQVIEEFEVWLSKHNLWGKEVDRYLNQAAFVTCGNWDLKTKIPQQCEVSRMKLPAYFMEWINLKDVYLNFYNKRAPGMLSMMRQLGITQLGSHHLGIDDSMNIARVLQRLLIDGSVLEITARRVPGSPDKVRFLFDNRI